MIGDWLNGVGSPNRRCIPGLQIFRVSTPVIAFTHCVLKDATPRNPRRFGALYVEKPRVPATWILERSEPRALKPSWTRALRPFHQSPITNH